MNPLTYIVPMLFTVLSSALVHAQDSNAVSHTTADDQWLLRELDGVTAIRRAELPRWEQHTAIDRYSGDLTLKRRSTGESAGKRGYAYRKLRLENFIVIDTGDFYLSINPAFNFEAGMDLKDTSAERLYVNTRGISAHGRIGRNVTFFSRVYENQAFMPAYLDDFVADYGVIPGQGRIKTFKNTGYDYAMAMGAVSFSPNKHFNIQLGNGKHFLGDGYRSLALSGNAFSYPFVKLTTWFGPFQYTNLYMGLQNLNVELPTSKVTERRYQRKVATLHHLDWSVNERLTLGVFEEMVWAGSKSNGKLEINSDALSFLNPVLLVRPFQYGLSDENNVLAGINGKVTWPAYTEWYGQFILDDLPDSRRAPEGKNGFQLGVRTWALRNLMARVEFNKVKPYTYAHADSTRNFAHYNQPLAHPLGAGFSEWHGSLSYAFKDFFAKASASYALYDDDEDGYHWGKNIFKSDDDKTVLGITPRRSVLQYHSLSIGYLVNSLTGMQVSLGFINRSESGGGVRRETQYMFLSFSTNIPARIYDY